MSYTPLLDGAGIIAIIISGYIYLRSSTRKVNDQASVELIANLTKLRETDREEFNARLKNLEEQHLADMKLMAHMQGQIATYKELPLERLAISMDAIAADTKLNVTAIAEMLTSLQRSALIAREDRSVLTGAKTQNIEEQTVEHQVVKEVKK